MLSGNLTDWERKNFGPSSSQQGRRTWRPSASALTRHSQQHGSGSRRAPVRAGQGYQREAWNANRNRRVAAPVNHGSLSAPNEACIVGQDGSKTMGSQDEMHEATLEELKKFTKSSLAALSAEMGTACICGVHETSQPPKARFGHREAHFHDEIGYLMVCPHGILFTISALENYLTRHDPDWSHRMPHALLQQARGAAKAWTIQDNSPMLHSDDGEVEEVEEVVHSDDEVEEVVDLVTRRSKKSSGPSQVTLLSLSKYFHLTLKDAAKAMKVSVTSLKKASRELGIPVGLAESLGAWIPLLVGYMLCVKDLG